MGGNLPSRMSNPRSRGGLRIVHNIDSGAECYSPPVLTRSTKLPSGRHFALVYYNAMVIVVLFVVIRLLVEVRLGLITFNHARPIRIWR